MTTRLQELTAFLQSRSLANLAEAAIRYDVAVIGGGPAGALAARQLALRGVSVLLVDKAEFPRAKVCGCCLSMRALQALELAGLGSLAAELEGTQLRHLLVGSSGPTLRLELPAGRAISRELFDSALAASAIAAGASFLQKTTAYVGTAGDDNLEIILDAAEVGGRRTVKASIAVIADGIGGTALHTREKMTPVVRSYSRIGAAAISERPPEFYTPGTIFMAYGEHGYAGVVRLEDMRADVAAAIDPAFVKDSGTPAAAVAALLSGCGWPVPADLSDLNWKGTPALTRKRPSVAAQRIFVIGDAAGYVEPFTGEGIAWALTSAQAVAPVVLQAVRHWDDSLMWRWEHIYRRIIRHRQSATKIVTNLLRLPAAARLASDVLKKLPMFAEPLVNFVSGPMDEEELEWLRS